MGKSFDTSKIKVAVGLSGGVDSSVTALLLKKAGFDVTGVYLKCYWTHVGCSSDKDRSSAVKVASFLSLPFEVWDFSKEYKEKVIDYFYAEYEKGRTPNPDVVCNREIKFGLFYEKAVKERGFNFIATGHYAGTEIRGRRVKSKGQSNIIAPFYYQESGEGDNRDIKLVIEPKYFELLEQKSKKEAHFYTYYSGPSIFGGVDKKKDQSYFLYDIEEKAIEHSLYPLFGLLKSDVRQMAKSSNLPTANRPDSQGICFIGEINIEKFLKERIAEHEGAVVDVSGNVIGRHKGIEFYTIGQRHGFRVDSRVSAETDDEEASDSRKNSLKESPIPSDGMVPLQRSLLHKSSPRKAFHPANLKGQYRGPLYVIGKEAGRNRLVVGVGEECKRDKFTITNGQWTKNSGEEIYQLSIVNCQLFVRIRNLGEMIPCRVGAGFGSALKGTATRSLGDHNESLPDRSLVARHAPDSGSFAEDASSVTARRTFKPVSSTLEVKLECPVFGVAPGQSAVFYRQLQTTNYQLPTVFEVVGGGVIDEGKSGFLKANP